jgi:1-acyl-sn-glycerol-3-phosphate acyltransferase
LASAVRVLRAVLFLALAPLATVVGSILCTVGLLFAPRTGRVANAVERVWGRLFVASAGGRLRVEGVERVDRRRARMFVANHASFLDPPALIAALPVPLRFVLKKELGRIPIAGWYMALSGHFMLDRSDPRAGLDVMRRAVERARRHGLCPVVFPEGTRSPDGRLGDWKPGAFQLAIDGGLDVQPVAILGSHAILPKRTLAPRRGGTIVLRVGDPIPVEGHAGSAGRKALADRARAALLSLGVPP